MMSVQIIRRIFIVFRVAIRDEALGICYASSFSYHMDNFKEWYNEFECVSIIIHKIRPMKIHIVINNIFIINTFVIIINGLQIYVLKGKKTSIINRFYK